MLMRVYENEAEKYIYFDVRNEGGYIFGQLSGMIEIFTCLGEFAKVRRATTSFVISVRPSVRSHRMIRLPLDGFL
jgi:hypothetical protein